VCMGGGGGYNPTTWEMGWGSMVGLKNLVVWLEFRLLFRALMERLENGNKIGYCDNSN